MYLITKNTQYSKVALLASLILGMLFFSLISDIAYAAQTPPNDLEITRVRVYRNIAITGDIAFIIEYDIKYDSTPEPIILPSQAFSVRLIDGSTTIGGSNVFHYQESIVNLYSTSLSDFDWLGAYQIRLTADPTEYPAPCVPDNCDISYTLTPGDYVTTETRSAARSEFRQNFIFSARRIQRALGIEDSNPFILQESYGGVLTDHGENYFSTAIPNLRDMSPQVFGAVVDPIILERIEHSNTYEQSRANFFKDTPYYAPISKSAENFGISEGAFGVIFILLFYFISFSMLMMFTGNSMLAYVGPTPLLIWAVYIGMVPMGMFFILAMFLTLAMTWMLIMQRA